MTKLELLDFLLSVYGGMPVDAADENGSARMVALLAAIRADVVAAEEGRRADPAPAPAPPPALPIGDALVRERLAQHRAALDLWSVGYFDQVEPVREARSATMDRIRAQINELEWVLARGERA